MASRGLSFEEALLKLQVRANLLPIIDSPVQLRGETKFCPVYIAYGKMADGCYTGFWATPEIGDWKQMGQEMTFKPEITEDMVPNLLIAHAEIQMAGLDQHHMLDKGWWSHNRG